MSQHQIKEKRQRIFDKLQQKGQNYARAAAEKTAQMRNFAAEKSKHLHQKDCNELFGFTLEEAVLRSNQRLGVSENVPRIVSKCIACIQEKALDEVGIYRLSGSAKTIQTLKAEFDRNFDADLEFIDPNAVAGLLKLYVREFPETVLTNQLFRSFFAIFNGFEDELYEDSMILTGKHPVLQNLVIYREIELLLKELPTANREFLRVMMSHLKMVADNYQVNKMGITNLSVVWSPTIMFGGSLFVFLAYHSGSLFGDKEAEVQIPSRKSSYHQGFLHPNPPEKTEIDANEIIDYYPERNPASHDNITNIRPKPQIYQGLESAPSERSRARRGNDSVFLENDSSDGYSVNSQSNFYSEPELSDDELQQLKDVNISKPPVKPMRTRR